MTIEIQLKKKCRQCGKWKFKKDFSPAPRNKDGLFSYCRPCNAAKVKAHRRRNLSQLEINRISRQQTIAAIKMECSCVRCGTRFPKNPEVMDFDHLRDKSFNVNSNNIEGHTVDEIKDEMDKCQLLCSNCHRITTRERRDGVRVDIDQRRQRQNELIIEKAWSIYDRRNSIKEKVQ